MKNCKRFTPTNQIRKLRKKNVRSSNADKIPKIGEKLVTESLVVYSTATVVWQDGTIETDIQSTELCPIHHLDDHVRKVELEISIFVNEFSP
jgi:ubiquitin-conjugating enzyme E2 O